MNLRPFKGLLPRDNSVAEELVCPPYDVVSCDEARAIIKTRPRSFMSVVRPDASVAPDVSPYDDSVYQLAKERLAQLISDRDLVQGDEAALYVYEQHDETTARRQQGVVGLVSTSDYESDIIKKHERTRPEKENDRTRLSTVLSAQTGPVFLTYKDVPDIDEIVTETITSTKPLYDVVGDDKVRHRVWRMPENKGDAVLRHFHKHVPVSYIADGHHRAASAARVARDTQTRETSESVEEDRAWFLAALFPCTQVTILPYNRIVKDLGDETPESFLDKLKATCPVVDVEESEIGSPLSPGQVRVFVGHKWYELSLAQTSTESKTPCENLDCSLLQGRVLGPILGIEDPRTSPRIEFVGGDRTVAEIEGVVRSRGTGAAFLMHPVSVHDLMRVADANEIMPPKSTWFEPKLRSAFFVHTF